MFLWRTGQNHSLTFFPFPRSKICLCVACGLSPSICALWSLSYSPLVFNDHIFSSLCVVSAHVHICVWVYLSCVEVKGPHYNVFLNHSSPLFLTDSASGLAWLAWWILLFPPPSTGLAGTHHHPLLLLTQTQMLMLVQWALHPLSHLSKLNMHF